MIWDVVASIAVALLKAWFGRLDQVNAAQAKVLQAYNELTEEANVWLANALRDPQRSAQLRSVYPDAKIILGSSAHTDSAGRDSGVSP